MKDLNYLNEYRYDLYGDGMVGDAHNGCFIIPMEKNKFFVIVSNGDGWEHVSMHLLKNNDEKLDRTPKWDEMCKLKELFFEDDEVVMQLHPAKENYVNFHPYTLHLWRPLNKEIPTPPKYMI